MNYILLNNKIIMNKINNYFHKYNLILIDLNKILTINIVYLINLKEQIDLKNIIWKDNKMKI
jgi:hypothetical protein